MSRTSNANNTGERQHYVDSDKEWVATTNSGDNHATIKRKDGTSLEQEMMAGVGLTLDRLTLPKTPTAPFNVHINEGVTSSETTK